MEPKPIYQDINLNGNKLHKAKVEIVDRNAIASDDIIDKQFVEDTFSEAIQTSDIGITVVPLVSDAIPQEFVPNLKSVTISGHRTDKITIDATELNLKDLSWLSQTDISTITGQWIEPVTNKVYILGKLYTVSNGFHKCLRLNSDGTLDATFFIDATINQLTDIADASAVCTDSLGNVYIGFYYDLDDFPTGKRLLKLSSTGTIISDWSSKVANPKAGTSQSYDYVSKLWHDGTALWVSFSSVESAADESVTYFYDSIEYSSKIFKINSITGAAVQWFLPHDTMMFCEDFLVEEDRVIVVGAEIDVMIVVFDNPGIGESNQIHVAESPYAQYEKSSELDRIYRIVENSTHYYCLGIFATDINSKTYKRLFVINKTTFELLESFDTTAFTDAIETAGLDVRNSTLFLDENDDIIMTAGSHNLNLSFYDVRQFWGIVKVDKTGKVDNTFAQKTTMTSIVQFADKTIVGLSTKLSTLTDSVLTRNWYQINTSGLILDEELVRMVMLNGSAAIVANYIFDTSEYSLLNKRQILKLISSTTIDIESITGANRELVPDYIASGITLDNAQFDEDDWLVLTVSTPLANGSPLLDSTKYVNCQARVLTPNGHVYVDCIAIGNVSDAINTSGLNRLVRIKDIDKKLISEFGDWTLLDVWFNIDSVTGAEQTEVYAKSVSRTGTKVLISDGSESHSIVMTDFVNEYYTGPSVNPAVNTYLEGATSGLLTTSLWQAFAELYDGSMVVHAESSISSSIAPDAQANVMFVIAHNSNASARLDVTDSSTHFFPNTVLVSAGDPTDPDFATNWETSYGFGVEFCEQTYPSVSVAQNEQSPATAIVAAKLMSIRDLTNASWRVVRKAARQTASNSGVWDMYRGFGVIDVDAAIEFIFSQNYSQKLVRHHNDKNRLHAIVNSVDVHKDAFVPKRHIPFVAENAKVLMTSMETSSVAVTSGHTFVLGKMYLVTTLNVGDDFANQGYVSENVPFIATEETPTVWTNGSIVYQLNVTRTDFQNQFSEKDITINFSGVSGGDSASYVITSDTIVFDYAKIFITGAIVNAPITKDTGGTYSIDTLENKIILYYGGDITTNLACQLLLAIKP